MRCLGKIFLVLILIVAAWVAFFFWKGPALDAQSKDYVDTAVPAIFKNWSKEEVLQRASPELTALVKENDLANMFSEFSQRLGVLVHSDSATGNSSMFLNQRGLRITAHYNVNAQFALAPAIIHIALIKHGDQWELLGLNIESHALLK